MISGSPSAQLTDTLRVTAVVCTYTEARWSLIVDAVDSLRRQSRVPDEILLVVDYNPALAERLRHEIAGVRVVENRHTKGLSGAKNTALDDATGSILAVLDDDATADEGWLETLLAHFASDRVVAAGSASVPSWEHERPRWFAPELDWTIGCSYRGLPETATPVRNVFGGAMALRCDAARQLGGFDHQLGRGQNRFGGAEETEFCIRLAAVGPDTTIVYDPATTIHHRVPATRAAWSYVWRRCYGEGISKATLARLAKPTSSTGGDALRTERHYLTRTIPSGLWREVRHARPDAAAALLAAVAATSAGFMVGKAKVVIGGHAVIAAGATPILCYHGLGDRFPDDELPFAFPVDAFAHHLDQIAARGLKTVTISDLARRRRQGSDDRHDIVAITFDDGYADLLSIAAPMLAARSMVATAFVTTSYVDGRTRGDAGFERWLSWDEARQLSQSNIIEIGGHSHDHVELDMLTAQDVHAQIARCHERLRTELAVDATSFAYPYGYSNAEIRRLLPSVGFTAACGVRHAISSGDDDPLNLARVRLLRRHTSATVDEWISGRNIRTTPCPDELRTRVFRPVRRVRHELRRRRAVSAR